MGVSTSGRRRGRGSGSPGTVNWVSSWSPTWPSPSERSEHRFGRLRGRTGGPPGVQSRENPVAHRPRVRGRHRGHQSAPGPCLDPVGDLLCLAPPGSLRGDHRWDLFHPPGPDHHPGPFGALSLRQSAAVGPRCRRGAGAAVPAVALNAALGLAPGQLAPGRDASEPSRPAGSPTSWLGGISAATIGPFLVLVLIVSGAVEIAVRTRGTRPAATEWPGLFPATALPIVTGGVAALCWVAFKVGALSYGGAS